MGKKKRSSSGKSQESKIEKEKSWVIIDQVKPPEPFNFQEPTKWTVWMKRYKIFHSAVGLPSKSEDQQVNMLLYCMGQEADNLLSSLGITEEKRTSFNSVVKKFEEYFMKEKNTLYNRVLFLERNQRPGEKVDSYIDELSKISEKCEWSCRNCMNKDLMDEIMLVKLVTGVRDKKLSKRLQFEGITTLTEVLKVVRESEEKSCSSDVSTSEDLNAEGSERKSMTKQGLPEEDIKQESSIVKPLSSESTLQHKGFPGESLNVKFKEENGNVRSSLNSTVTGDNCSHSEAIHQQTSNVKPLSRASAIQNQEFPALPRRNFPHFTPREEKGSMRSSFSSGVDSCDEYDDFNRYEDNRYLDFLNSLRQPEDEFLYTLNNCSSVKTSYKLDDFVWPQCEKPHPKVDNKPTNSNNYNFSVTGRQSMKALRKMCQQHVKNSY